MPAVRRDPQQPKGVEGETEEGTIVLNATLGSAASSEDKMSRIKFLALVQVVMLLLLLIQFLKILKVRFRQQRRISLLTT